MKKTGLLLLVLILTLTACTPTLSFIGGNDGPGALDTDKPAPPPDSSSAISERPGSSVQSPAPGSQPPAKEDVSSPPDNTAESSSAASSAQSSTASQGSPPADVSSQPPSSAQPESEPQSSSEPAAASSVTQSSSEPAAADSAASSTAPSSSQAAEYLPTQPRTTAVHDEVKAVWFSYLEFLNLAQNKTESEFTSNISLAFSKVADAGFNSVWVQVRPFGDAMYPSNIFPYSYVLTGAEGQSPGYDPLAIMVREAHSRGLLIEAWINPYRIRANASDKALSEDNPAVRLLAQGSDAVIRYGNIISYNPASNTARDLIVQGVVEIIENYSVDGIHFDDYFYPTTELAFDTSYYNAYRSSGGRLSQEDWRRQNVNQLISQVYSAIKQADSSVVFGVSPQANMSNNYNSQFADVAHWLANTGYVDYICPQVYFGFENQTLPFASTVQDWSALITNGHTKLYVGLAAYKIGSEDKYAGSGSREWITGKNILARMISESRACSNYAGFGMYRYDFLFSPASGVRAQMEGEMSALKQIIK